MLVSVTECGPQSAGSCVSEQQPVSNTELGQQTSLHHLIQIIIRRTPQTAGEQRLVCAHILTNTTSFMISADALGKHHTTALQEKWRIEYLLCVPKVLLLNLHTAVYWQKSHKHHHSCSRETLAHRLQTAHLKNIYGEHLILLLIAV